jgi:hypothetical protein
VRKNRCATVDVLTENEGLAEKSNNSKLFLSHKRRLRLFDDVNVSFFPPWDTRLLQPQNSFSTIFRRLVPKFKVYSSFQARYAPRHSYKSLSHCFFTPKFSFCAPATNLRSNKIFNLTTLLSDRSFSSHESRM